MQLNTSSIFIFLKFELERPELAIVLKLAMKSLPELSQRQYITKSINKQQTYTLRPLIIIAHESGQFTHSVAKGVLILTRNRTSCLMKG